MVGADRKMKTRIIISIVAVSMIVISGFFVYAISTNSPSLTHHDEVRPPIPDDHFEIHGMKWEWNDYVYDVYEEINFSISRHAKTCGDVFDAKIMDIPWSGTIWQESIPSNCIADHEELIDNDYYSVFVTAEFPSQNSIKLEEGLYVLQVKSQDSHVDSLNGQFIVKNKTQLSLPPCTSDRTACFNRDANLCDPRGWNCVDTTGIFAEIVE